MSTQENSKLYQIMKYKNGIWIWRQKGTFWLKLEFCNFLARSVFSSFLFLWCSSFALSGYETYLMNPPKGWECISDPSQLPKKIKIIYVGKGSAKNPFTPSINIACEETTLPLKEYLTLAKNYHEGQGITRCTTLGKIHTQSGEAELLQIDSRSQWGDVRFMQAMMIQNGEAYVVTATCLKTEFSTYSSQIFKAIQSFIIQENSLRTK